MAITIINYVNYVIYFTDISEYNFAVAVAGGNVIAMTPVDAISTFGLSTGVGHHSGYYEFFPLAALPGFPLDMTEVFGTHIPPNIYFLDASILSFTIPSSAFSGYISTQPNQTFIWSGSISFLGTASQSTDVTAPVPLRRWIMGFENPGGEGVATVVTNITRDASRTLDGLGFALRNNTNTNISRTLAQYRTGLVTNSSWERFYLRVRTFGVAKIDIWKCVGTPSAGNGARIYLESDGSISVYNVNASNVETLLGTSNSGDIVLDTWNKIDVLPVYNTLASLGNGTFDLYLNGVLLLTFSIAAASAGMGANSTNHVSTLFGTQLSGANVWEIDLDDWTSADIPSLNGVVSLTSIDWLAGTHIRKTFVDSGSITGWTGQVEFMNQMMAPVNALSVTKLTSVTALSQLIGVTNANDDPDPIGTSLFATSVIVSRYGNRGSTANGQLGYSLAGGPQVLTALSESTSPNFLSVGYMGTGVDVIPSTIVPLEVIYEKGNETNSSSINALGAVVEYAGAWGDCDITGNTVTPQPSLVHNAWFANLAWAFLGPVSVGINAAVGGTYVGNGTSQAITLPAPCHFLVVRPLSGSTTDTKWFGSGLGGHLGSGQATIPADVTRVFYDPITNITSFIVTGANPQTNVNGVTYQYIAFCDPGMLYNICGAFSHISSLSSASNELVDSSFTPDAVFFDFELLSASSTVVLSYKGAGHSGIDGTLVDGTNLANLAAISTGLITSGSDAHSSNQQTTYSAWRTGDNCGDVMVQITSYVGDGTASQLINITPQSTRFPLFAYVQPHNAVGYVRDPSDVGNSSRKITDGSAISTAITAGGQDTLTVGSTLNALGVTYEVFVIPGDPLGWNNGTFAGPTCNPTCVADSCTPIPPQPGIILLPDGGLDLGDTAGGGTGSLLLKDVSGIYTLVTDKANDTLFDRQTGQTNVDVAIPDPSGKTGFIGG